MRAPLTLALVGFSLAFPALAACPSDQFIGAICKPGADLAARLARTMPVTLDTYRLTVAVGTTSGLTVVALPDPGQADPTDAAEYLCEIDAARSFVASGGEIEVLMIDAPFLTLTDCEGY